MAYQIKQLLPVSVLLKIAFYGLILNAIWEFAHAGLLYDMWNEVPLAKGLFHIMLAILGDMLIVLAISIVAVLICGLSDLLSLGYKSFLCMLLIGFTAGMVLEWIPKLLGWWTYNDLMPTLTIMGETVGLSPLLQITLLPSLSVFLAIKGRGSYMHFMAKRN